MLDKEIKLELLDLLMSEMDDSLLNKLKSKGKKDELEVTSIETKEMPIDKIKDMVKEKMMSGGEVEDDEEMEMPFDPEEDEDEDEEY